jgi:CRISPR-associated helicase Cas3/CRISPR-associated endonuclease Cas3-HD
MYYAHSGSSRERWEPLRVHLLAVAERAARFAAPFHAAEEARLAGLLHDLGKYSDLFTRRLNGQASRLDHWSAGAFAACREYRQAGFAAALAIQGHHIGLLSLSRLQETDLRSTKSHPRGLRFTETDLSALLGRLKADGIELPPLSSSLFDNKSPTTVAGMLDVRMLFSALVDADFLETEAHFRADASGQRFCRPEGLDLQPARALDSLLQKVRDVAGASRATSEVNRLRQDLLEACLAAAEGPPGLFTLSAPTGAGKTLAMLAFALRHAERNGMRRIVMAIPYLSILEQTARIYRELLAPTFGDSYLLEHHSLAGTRREPGEDSKSDGSRDQQEAPEQLARWLTENWDAPLVVTTSVQLLESLFSNRPSACRKLHRLAGSVLLFDEVQTLPPQLAVPTLAALSRLAERYGASVVFATATQPAFDHLHDDIKNYAPSGWQPREIAPPSLQLFERARRTRVAWDVEKPISWEALAGELAGHDGVLCIVNLKRHARTLAEKLQQRGVTGLFHLSTNLCPAHRERVLAEVRQRLQDGQTCRLISTQCIEAGVDVDFPRVYRALGPLEAVAQAAGRCNRSGNLPGLGEVRVFLPEDVGYPPGGYEQATDATRLLLKSLPPERMEDIQSPDLFRGYYKSLYDLAKVAEPSLKIRDALGAREFEKMAEHYRLIDQDTISVLVPYDLDVFADLRAELRTTGLTGGWIRRARPHTVSLFRPKRTDLLWGYLEPAARGRQEEDRQSQEWFVYLEASHYDRDLLGLVGPSEGVWIA